MPSDMSLLRFFILLAGSGAHGVRIGNSASAFLRPDSKVAKTVAKLEAQGWALPIPKYTPQFEEEHGCMRDAPPSWSDFSSLSKWPTSSQRGAFRDIVREATEDFTKAAFVSLFEAHHGSEDAAWLLETFACHAKRSGIRPIILAMDEETQQQVNSHPPLLGVHLPDLIADVRDFFRVEDADVYLMKWPAALAAMGEGAPSVFVSDVDVLWLQDPRQHLSSFGEVEAMVALDSQQSNLEEPEDRDREDFWQEKAGHWAAGDNVPICCRGAFPFNAGQVFFNSKPSTKQLLGQMIGLHALRVRNTSQHDGCHEDQDPMQWALYGHCATSPDRCKILDPRLFMDFSLGQQVRGQAKAGGPYTIHFDTHDKRPIMTQRMKDLRDSCLDSRYS